MGTNWGLYFFMAYLALKARIKVFS